ncbi:hypothetical protein B0J11DRAFT_564730, partial [Dendryphion nanum]
MEMHDMSTKHEISTLVNYSTQLTSPHNQPHIPPTTMSPSPLATHLSVAIQALRADYVSGARQLADKSLLHLKALVPLAANDASTEEELWASIVQCAKSLSEARPSMNAAIKSTLLYTLSNASQSRSESQSQSTLSLSSLTISSIDRTILERGTSTFQTSQNFTTWLRKTYPVPKISILTLSNSSSISSALLQVLTTTEIWLKLIVLESRPRCEGADFVATLLGRVSGECRAEAQGRLEILVAPDCAVGSVMRDVDILLLGADRIDSRGDVSNKIGSLAAAVCAKSSFVTGEKETKVVVLAEVDKICSWRRGSGEGEEGEKEIHATEEVMGAWGEKTRRETEGFGVGVFGEWFEWVPGDLVDLYITDRGVWGNGEVEGYGKEVGRLESMVFGGAELV